MSGFVGDLSPKQEKLLQQFKENVADLLTKPKYDDHYLLKWLRARWWDVKKAEKMFRENLKWREREQADTILQDWEPPEVLTKYYPGGLLCYDREGCPVWIDLVGYTDMKGLLYSARKQDLFKLKIQHCERIQKVYKEQSEKLGKRVDNVILIHDLDQFGLRHLWKPGMDVLSHILGFIEANYPESLKVCFIVNDETQSPPNMHCALLSTFSQLLMQGQLSLLFPAEEMLLFSYKLLPDHALTQVWPSGGLAPKIFPIAYNIVKPFLNDDTKRKIQILGRNWKSKLVEHIDPSELPVHWGGNATDPDGDPYCRSRISLGGEVPKSYYLLDSLTVDLESFHTLTVGRGSSVKLEYEVEKQGCVIRWQFKTDGYDIGFGVFRKTDPKQESSSDMEVVLSSERFNSHMVPEDGSWTLQDPGTYVIRFDNTYSWVNSKVVHYLVEVLDKDEDDEFYDALENGMYF